MNKKILIGLVAGVIFYFLISNFSYGQTCNIEMINTIRYGQRGALVRNVQACLIELGYSIPAGATGYFGVQTKQAISKFYADWYGKWLGYSLGPKGVAKLKEILKEKLSLKGVKPFTSKEEFKNYLEKAKISGRYSVSEISLRSMTAPMRAPGADIMAERVVPERVSETNVQVPGIDEPDILKTDGKEIYFSPRRNWPIWIEMGIPRTMSLMPTFEESKIKVIKAFPPTDLNLDSQIEKSGDLLLVKDKNVLVVFGQREILGYDVSNPKDPQKRWGIKLDDRNSIVTSRLYKGKIYLVTQNIINEFDPCPFSPLIIQGRPLTVPCHRIYHPIIPIPTDIVFSAMVLNPESGEIEKQISFVGSWGGSVVYMSENAIYITYSYNESWFSFLFGFVRERGSDLFPKWFLDKLEQVASYDISDEAKITEFYSLLEKYQQSLTKDNLLKFQNEMTNRMSDYAKANKRKLEKTAIVKIGLDNFEVLANGEVPGYPLNQFALDEYPKNLRIAITVGRFTGLSDLANDVYVLDENLRVLGKVQDLGLTERIYSVRFIEDKGYLVTFRQIDPFYVLDLSNPYEPKLKGELKIPGYSSYLHPITKDKIIGVGMEDSQVKVSLFDVSNPEKPQELDKYILNESWSAILETHHAFLLDGKHEIFFLPGSQGGYIFSYKNDKLNLIKSVSQQSPRRAIYIDDYLYIVSDNKITVLNEINWETVKEFEF